MYSGELNGISKEELKEFRREIGLSSLMGNNSYKLTPNLNNLIKYNTEKLIKRKLTWGFLPFGDRYEVYDFYKDSEHYKIIKKLSEKYDFIVTGSVALRIFGVLDRFPAYDIDVIASEETIKRMKEDSELKEYKYVTNVYGDSNAIRDFDLRFSFKFDDFSSTYKVDTFVRDEVDYDILDGIKIAKPFDVLSMKLKFGRDKDMWDCRGTIKMIKSQDKNT